MADSTKKLTEGSPMRLVLGFSIPLLSGLLFQQMYNLVDTIIVGQCLGTECLAAVGSTGAINFLVNGFCIGVCSGFAIPVAQRFGAESYDSMRRFVTNAVELSAIMAGVLTLIVCVFCRQILLLMNTPVNIIDGAYSYIFIIFLGIPVTFLYNLTAGVMRSLGDSKTPVYFLLMASVINIVLDLLFIMCLKTSVEGPAIATVISQFIAGMACLIVLRYKFPLLKQQPGDWKMGKHHTSVLLSMGLPMGLQYSITAVGSVILQTAVNGLGSDAVAAVSAASKLNQFLMCPFDALGSTMATFAGQNVGAKKIDRVRQGLKDASIIGFIYTAIAFVIVYFFGRSLLLLFLDSSATDIIENANNWLLMNVLFFFALDLVNCVRFSIQGMGFSVVAVLAGVMEMVARVLVAVFLVPTMGFGGVVWANPAAWIFADAFLVPTFLILARKLERKMTRLI